jgi:hypothetical protein
MTVLRHHEVLEHRHPSEQPHLLEGTADTHRSSLVCEQVGDVALIEEDASALGPEQPADHVEQGRLPGAVGPQEPHDLTLSHHHVHVVERGDASEPEGDPIGAKHDRLAHPDSLTNR